VECEVTPETAIAKQVTRTITELKALQEPILAGEVAPDVLEEFRDALNRVRNSAWAAQQSVAGLLLGERGVVGGVVSGGRAHSCSLSTLSCHSGGCSPG
jgi:hypothetical protein